MMASGDCDSAMIPQSGGRHNTHRGGSAIPPEELARLLSQFAGQPIAPEHIMRDIADGAPARPDGTLSILPYAAWLAAQHSIRAR